eukprot:1952881-Pyramimonas_sp.AAC.1
MAYDLEQQGQAVNLSAERIAALELFDQDEEPQHGNSVDRLAGEALEVPRARPILEEGSARAFAPPARRQSDGGSKIVEVF